MVWAADGNVLVQGADVWLGLGPSQLVVLGFPGRVSDEIPYAEVSCRAEGPGRAHLGDVAGPYATLEPLGHETAEQLALEFGRRRLKQSRTANEGTAKRSGPSRGPAA